MRMMMMRKYAVDVYQMHTTFNELEQDVFVGFAPKPF